VVYAGATGPRMGVLVVDAGGGPRAMVGPVARAFELTRTTEKRFDDETGVAAPDKRDPWARSYTASAPAAPAFALGAAPPYEGEKGPAKIVLRARAVALPKVTVELTDHHGVVIATTTRSLAASSRVAFAMTAPSSRHAEGVRVRIADFMADDSAHGPSSAVQIESGGVVVEGDDRGETSK